VSEASDESIPGFEDVVHWVDGELLIKPEYKAEQEAQQRRRHPEMTELQIQASWGVLQVTLGIGVDTSARSSYSSHVR
jgi:hypothetical protein